MKQIYTSKAPEPIGPYSQAIETDNFIFLSGQIALKDGVLQNENIEMETQQVLQNIEEILKKAKIGKENIVKTTIFLKDLNDFQKVNQIYQE